MVDSEFLGVYQLKTSTDPALSAAVVKFAWKGADLKPAYDMLWQKHKIACALTPAGDEAGLRFSPHIYNSPEEIDQTIAAVREQIRT